MTESPIDYRQHLARYFTNLVSALTFLGVLFLAFKVYKAEERADAERKLLEERYGRLTDTKEDYEQLSATIGQLASIYKDQADLAKEVSIAWKELALERGERIKLAAESVVKVDSDVERQDRSDYSFLTKEGTQGYVINELRIAGKDSPPIGFILVKNDGEVFKKNYRFEIRIESVQLKDDLTGKIRIVSRAFLVPLENGLAEKRRPDLKKWAGEKYPLKVTGGEVLIDPQEPLLPPQRNKGWVFWPMNLNGGFGLFGTPGDGLDTKVTVDTNLLGYGYSKQDLDWKIAHLGFNYNKADGLGIHVIPFSYRPFPSALTNTYIGPGAFTTPDSRGYFFGLNIGF